MISLSAGYDTNQRVRRVQSETRWRVQVPSNAKEPLWMGRVRHYDEFRQGQRNRRSSGVHEDFARSAQSARGGHSQIGMRGKCAIISQSFVSCFYSALFTIKFNTRTR